MIEIKEMTFAEIEALLGSVRYGHLGCAKDGHPYVVPVSFAYDNQTIYLYTTEGKKSDILDANPEVCLQVEEVVDNHNWRSAIIVGRAERLTGQKDREKAMAVVTAANPDLAPALSYRWLDDWVREERDTEIIYRINRESATGRQANGH
jgi:nitroimidazol reductase NimA-like FMN-containing flavoprotein (pyridoxamine 5'-phosphate oxidase superfamily)